MIISVRLRLIYHNAAGLNNYLILNMKLYDFSHVMLHENLHFIQSVTIIQI